MISLDKISKKGKSIDRKLPKTEKVENSGYLQKGIVSFGGNENLLKIKVSVH